MTLPATMYDGISCGFGLEYRHEEMPKTMILSIGSAKPGLGDWDREGGGGRKVSSNKKILAINEWRFFIKLPIYPLKSLRFY